MVFSGSFAPPSVIAMEVKMKIFCHTAVNEYCSVWFRKYKLTPNPVVYCEVNMAILFILLSNLFR